VAGGPWAVVPTLVAASYQLASWLAYQYLISNSLANGSRILVAYQSASCGWLSAMLSVCINGWPLA